MFGDDVYIAMKGNSVDLPAKVESVFLCARQFLLILSRLLVSALRFHAQVEQYFSHKCSAILLTSASLTI